MKTRVCVNPKRLMLMVVPVAAFFLAGCGPSEGEIFGDLIRQINALKTEKIALEERLAKRDARIESLNKQIGNLREQGRIAVEPVFEIERVKILGITGGSDLDGNPGDDHVTVYFRPVDRDGDVLKRAGAIVIKLLDNASALEPKVLGLRVDNDPVQIRNLWYGRFWTDHFKVEVPFYSPGELMPGQEIDVYLSFVEFATGRTFTDRKAITVNRIRPDDSGVQ